MPRDLRLLLVSTFLTTGSFGLLLPIVPLWALAGGASTTGAGATNATFLFVTVAAQVVSPAVLRMVGHRESLIAGGLFLGLPTFAYAFTSNLAPLIVISAARGIGFALVVVTGITLVARLLPGERRGRGFGLYGMAVGLPNLVFLPTGPSIAAHAGFQPLFVTGGALPLAGVVLVAAMRMRTRQETARRGGTRPQRQEISPLRTFTVPAVLMCAHALSSSTIVTFLPAALPGGTAVAAALFAYSVGTVAGRWAAGVLRDRSRRPVVLGPAAAVCTAGQLALAFAAVGDTQVVVAAAGVPGALAFGLGFGALQTDTLTVMFDRVPAHGYDLASTGWNMAFDSGTGIGSLVIGMLATRFDFPVAFTFAGVLLGLLVPVAVALGRPRPRAG